MPELVAMLSHVDHISLVACPFVSPAGSALARPHDPRQCGIPLMAAVGLRPLEHVEMASLGCLCTYRLVTPPPFMLSSSCFFFNSERSQPAVLRHRRAPSDLGLEVIHAPCSQGMSSCTVMGSVVAMTATLHSSK
jgi:hypothetical protein